MITVRTSPQYVNRVRQDWTANGGVYGDDGVYAIVPSNDPFAQLGPTLDLTFAGIPTNQFTAATTDGYSINLNLSSEIYQIAAEYVVWSDYQVKYSLLPNALINAALNIEPEKSLFKDTLIGGRPLGDINNDGSVTSADATAYTRFNGSFWLNTADRNDYIRTVLNPYMLANPGLYAAYLSPGPLAAKTFADVITFTRASTGTYFDSAGVLQSAANDQPRFDFNPSTLAAQGLLIEEQRTNSIRNNTMVGAVAGTPGTLPTNWNVSGLGALTQQVVGTGTVNGVTYIDLRFSGTTSTTQLSIRLEPGGTGAIAAANGQTWAMSMWSAIVAGGLTNINSYGYGTLVYDAVGGFIGAPYSNGTINTTSTLTRTQTAGTIAIAGTAFIQPQIYLLFNSGVAIDITLRIGLPQLEQGAFATSVIPTTTTALTRSADVASVNTLSPWFNATEGTLFAEYVATNASQNNAASAFSDGTNNNRMIIRATNASTQTAFIGVSSGSTQWAGVIATALLNTTTKSAFGYKVDDIAWVRNGGTVGTDTLATIPTVTGLKLGADGDGTLLLNGYLRRIVYYPRRLSNADLQTITA